MQDWEFLWAGTGIATNLQPYEQSCVVQQVAKNKASYFRRFNMLSWALTFLVLALIAAVLGFGGLASGMAGIAKILFFVFLVVFVISLIGHTMRGRPVV